MQLISAALEHSVLRLWEINALENASVLHCSLWAVQTINFPYNIYCMQYGMFKIYLKSTVILLELCSSHVLRGQLNKTHPLCMCLGVFVTLFWIAYAISPRFCHRFVGYLEEEAVKTYTLCLEVRPTLKIGIYSFIDQADCNGGPFCADLLYTFLYILVYFLCILVDLFVHSSGPFRAF